LALQTEPVPDGDSYVYRYGYSGVGGVSCSRVVVVGYGVRDPTFAPPPDNVPAPKHIISSYHERN
jgi:hypothetical protein